MNANKLNRQKNKKYFLAFGALLLSLTLACIGLALGKGGDQAHAEASFNVELESLYCYNAEIELPTTAKITADGGEYDATEGVCIYPDGVAYRVGRTFTLNQLGVYSVRYFYTANERESYVEKSFTVTNTNLSASSANTSFETVTLAKPYEEITEGLNVKMSAGDTVSYNKFVTLEDGMNEIAIVAPITAPDKNRVELRFRLTDCYDADNYVEFKIDVQQLDVNRYMALGHASFNGNKQYGYAGSPRAGAPKVTIGEKTYYAYWSTSYMPYATPYFTLLYDAEAKCAYIKAPGGTTLINDFTAFDLYGSDIFKGFATNEVKLTVTASNFSAEKYEVEFAKLWKDEGEQLANQLYVEKDAPKIDIDYTPTHKNTVYATKNEKIKVFDAEAIDLSGATLTKEVYYDYGKPSQTRIAVDDGYFVTRYLGEYTVVYAAEDVFGNQSVSTVKVICVATEDGKMISAEVENLPASAIVGETVQLPSLDEVKISTINANPACSVTAVYEKEGVEIALEEDMSFIPLYVGEWKIIYTVRDNVTTSTQEYPLTVTSSDSVVTDGEPIMPKYFIKGAKYSLEEYLGYAFKGENRETVALDVSVRFDATGEYLPVEQNVVTVTGSTSVSFAFSYEGKVVKTTAEYPVVDVGFGISNGWKINKYFTGEFDAEINPGYTTFLSRVESGENSLEFIKEISFSGFSLSFIPTAEKMNYGGVRITLTDYYNRFNRLEMNVKFVGEKTHFIVGEKVIGVDLNKATAEDMTVFYDAEKEVLGLSDALIPFKSTFTTDKCYLTVTLTDIEGESAINLKKINNQAIAKFRNDTNAPQIIAEKGVPVQSFGSKVVISIPTATDVLSPIVKSSITVEMGAPDGSFVTTVDGVTLKAGTLADREYVVELNAYGNYYVQYRCYDQNGKEASYIVNYSVLDLTAPEISFVGNTKVGDVVNVALYETHTIAQTAVSDNLDENVTVNVYRIDSLNELKQITESTYVPLERGLHKILIRAQDASGNSSYVYYYLSVE